MESQLEFRLRTTRAKLISEVSERKFMEFTETELAAIMELSKDLDDVLWLCYKMDHYQEIKQDWLKKRKAP